MIIGSRIFGGIAPRFPERKLKAPYAAVAENIKMERGQLRSYGGPVDAFAGQVLTANAETIIPYAKVSGAEVLLSWAADVDYVIRPIPNDSLNRVYWTGDETPLADGRPRMADELAVTGGQTVGPYPKTSYRLGVPAPQQQMLLERIQGPDVPADPEAEGWTPYYRSYTYTFVDKYKQESGPFAMADGTALERIVLYEGDSIRVYDMQGAPLAGDEVNFADGLIRVYQTDVYGNFRLAAELPAGTTEITFEHMEVNGAVARTLFTEPADDRMIGLAMSSFDFMYGFFDNTLCMSDVQLFHSWPSLYQRTTPTKIMGVVPVARGGLVICEGGVYLAFGSDPSNINVVPIDETKGCVSKQSIVNMGGYAMYASSGGLVVCDGSTAQVITSDVILDLDWPLYSPETMKAFRHKERYMIFNDSYGFALLPTAAEDKLTNFTFKFDGGFTYAKDSNWYYNDGGSIKRFDSDSANPLRYKWESSLNILDSPTTVSCVKLDVDGVTDLNVNVLMDDEPLFGVNGLDIPASTDKIIQFRLPSFPQAMEVKYTIEGTTPLNSFYLCNSFAELKQGSE